MKVDDFFRAERGDGDTYVVVFKVDNMKVTKRIRISGCARTVMQDIDLRREWWHAFRRAAQEAERDFAFEMFGEDKWREHVQPRIHHDLVVKLANEAAAFCHEIF